MPLPTQPDEGSELGDPAAAALKLVYQDEHLAVVDKPAGLLAHRSGLAAYETDFLLDRLRDQLGRRCHLIHRLDRATSGALLIAFDATMARQLGEQFMSREVGKTYLAIARGHLDDSGSIDHPLDAPGKPQPKPALTHYRRLASIELPIALGRYDSVRYSLLALQPETGRYRQLRRHLKHISHHLIGDTSHGEGRHNRLFRIEFGVHRMLLHAWRLSFQHPALGTPLDISAPLDADWQKLMQRFGWETALPAEDPFDKPAQSSAGRTP